MNVTQLVQFYLYTAITHNNATYGVVKLSV